MKTLAIALMMTLAAPALAQTTAPVTAPIAATAVKKGQHLKDANGVRLGEIDRVAAADDGSVAAVRIIFAQHFVTIPGSTLTLVDGKLVTSMTKSEIGKL